MDSLVRRNVVPVSHFVAWVTDIGIGGSRHNRLVRRELAYYSWTAIEP